MTIPELEFDDEHRSLVARKPQQRDPMDRVYGLLDHERSTDEMLEELRGPAELP
ncbi:MAG: hypothetical protein ACRDTC_00545 [Pseudonocardiaceae bacterium]